MRDLALSDFAPRLGRPFAVEAPGGRLQLVLAEAQELPGSARAGGGFRLEFRGPLQPLLPQASYGFAMGNERRPIFIVPIGPDGGAMRYEAIFY